MDSSRGILIGADGGGTRTTAVAADARGTMLARATGGPLNWNNIGLDAARTNLRAVADELLAATGAARIDALAVGAAALDGPADAETTRRFAGDAFDPASLRLVSDVDITLAAFAPEGPAAIVICGTGSMGLVRNAAGERHPIGGLGHKAGDPGGSHTLASEALARLPLRPADDPLLRAALQAFGIETPAELPARVAETEVRTVAAFAEPVLKAAAAGDAEAAAIVRRQMATLAGMLADTIRTIPEVRRIGLHGGVFRHSAFAREAFVSALPAGLEPELLAVPPEIGALSLLLH